MWNKALDRMLDGFIVTGRLTLTYPDGATRRYGPGQGADVQITLCDPALPRRLVRAPELALGDGYVDGTLTLGGDDLDGFFTLVTQNAAHPPVGLRALDMRLRRWRRWIDQANPAHRSRANVAHHYDLSGALYDLFLDADRQYSCAYFRDPGMTLEQAQAAKKHHIAAKLCLSPGMEVF